MHELGIIMEINKTLEQVAKENNVNRLSSVTLELGEVSGIVPDLLTDCWQYFRKKSELLCEADLLIEEIKGVTVCNSCKKTYETVKYAKECPYCKSFDTVLVTGNQCNIKEVIAF